MYDRAIVDTLIPAVFLVAIFVALFAPRWVDNRVRPEHRAGVWTVILGGAGIFGGLFAVYVAWSALRNQAELDATIAINSQASTIASWEADRAEIRCLYTWYDVAQDDALARDTCLDRIVENSDTFTEVMLYIEESVYILQQAERERKSWGTDWAESVRFWQQDVQDDETGLFSFHFVHRYPLEDHDPNTQGPVQQAKAAGLKITDDKSRVNLCPGYHRVVACIRANGRNPPPPPIRNICGTPDSVLAARLRQVAAVCAESRPKGNPTASASSTSAPRAPVGESPPSP